MIDGCGGVGFRMRGCCHCHSPGVTPRCAVPNSVWTTFQVRGEGDLRHALWLMRLSYLRYALKTASDPRGMLEHESEGLGLSTHLRSLLQQHLPTKERVTADPLTA
jgi:hypothetical protein